MPPGGMHGMPTIQYNMSAGMSNAWILCVCVCVYIPGQAGIQPGFKQRDRFSRRGALLPRLALALTSASALALTLKRSVTAAAVAERARARKAGIIILMGAMLVDMLCC